MSRKARVLSPTGIYHIILRTINQQQLFEDEDDYKKFIYMLGDCKSKYNFTIYGYCLMGNHVHLLISENEAPLKTIFRSFGSSFVNWYNAKYQRFGHLFQERFISIPILNDSIFLMTLDYIHKNPVKAKMSRYPSEYRWSSCSAYYGRKNNLVDTDLAISIAGSGESLRYYFHHNVHFDEVFEHENEAYDSVGQLSDSEAMKIIYDIAKCNSPSDFQKIPTVTRNDYIRKIFNSGVTPSQVARLCGVSRMTVYRVIGSK